MAIHKTDQFSAPDQQMSSLAKAMSHPARIAILRILAQRNNMTCGEIVELLPLAQATVSHHLKDLVDVSMINLIHEGKKSLYELNAKTWNAFSNDFSGLLSVLGSSAK
ncbi:helix-turn-helix transcriptional regulator [Mucilaginibacter sp. dw_454]|uniref:ArsR/SmtB family transcription factor n=1 Tax=Mucilaginibacter sp. dw_454 TaxID=2720079 RepID=UPI001BD274AF|nr:helix-turn-helix transcriptional regulator [Mucilaginibacter sp. dw_454]